MRTVRVDRQRIKASMSFSPTVSTEDRLRRLHHSADEDYDGILGEKGWVIDNVQILSTFPERGLEKVIALVTEHKEYQIPETTDEYERLYK